MAEPLSLEDKKKAALAWAITGSSKKAGEMTGLNPRTIRLWTHKEWWPALVQEAKDKNVQKLDASYTAIIDLAVTEISDRVKHGDHIYIGKEQVRRPMSGRDLVITAGTIQDKRSLLRHEPTRITDSTNNTLSELAKQFEDIANNTKSNKPDESIPEDKGAGIDNKKDKENTANNVTELKASNSNK